MAIKLQSLNFWGLSSVAILCIVFTGLFFGRPLQQLNPFTVQQILVIATITSAAVYKFAPRPQTIRFEIFEKNGALLSAILYVIFATATYLYVPHKVEAIHFFQFSILPIALIFWQATEQESVNQKSAIHLALRFAIISIAIGSFEEYLQAYVPNRFFDWRDIILNSVSSAFGATLGYLSLRKHHS